MKLESLPVYQSVSFRAIIPSYRGVPRLNRDARDAVDGERDVRRCGFDVGLSAL